MSGDAVEGTAEESIGQRVRRLRLERGLSQRELSAPGISYAYVSRIEAGHRDPSLKAMRLLARKLGVSPEYIEIGAEESKERELRLADAELELRLGRDLDKAEEVFRTEAADADEPSLEARAYAGLGLLAFQRGDAETAVQFLQRGIHSGFIPPEWRPEVYDALGAAYSASDRPALAVDLFQRSLAEVKERAPDDPTLHVRFGLYLGCAYSEMGDLRRAREATVEATEAVERVALPQTRINVYWTRARLAWLEERPDEALTYARRATALLDATEDTHQLARAHLFCAQLLNLEGQAEEAEAHLARAEPLIVVSAEASDLGVLRAEQAKVAAARERPQEALDLAAKAAELLGDDVRHVGLKWHALGLAHIAAGDLEAGIEWYRKALDALKEREQWRESAKVAREWADALRAAGREGEAFDLMEEAMVLSVRHMGRRQRRESRDATEPKRARRRSR